MSEIDQEYLMPSPQAYARLMKLLPKLSAMTDQHRLKVLSEIDRVLAAEGLTWADVAAALAPPRGETLAAADLLATIDRIEREDKNRILFLTPNARSFLAEMRERAAENDAVYLSGKQAVWLHALHAQAERERLRFEQQCERSKQLEQWRRERGERAEAEKPKAPLASGDGGGTLH
jgi:hypothetical protein